VQLPAVEDIDTQLAAAHQEHLATVQPPTAAEEVTGPETEFSSPFKILLASDTRLAERGLCAVLEDNQVENVENEEPTDNHGEASDEFDESEQSKENTDCGEHYQRGDSDDSDNSDDLDLSDKPGNSDELVDSDDSDVESISPPVFIGKILCATLY
jgi:hypothetical protein